MLAKKLIRKVVVVAAAGLPMALSTAAPAAACLCVPGEGKGLARGPFCSGPAAPTEHGLAKAIDRTDVITGCLGPGGGLMATVVDGGPPSGEEVDDNPNMPPDCEVVTELPG